MGMTQSSGSVFVMTSSSRLVLRYGRIVCTQVVDVGLTGCGIGDLRSPDNTKYGNPNAEKDEKRLQVGTADLLISKHKPHDDKEEAGKDDEVGRCAIKGACIVRRSSGFASSGFAAFFSLVPFPELGIIQILFRSVPGLTFVGVERHKVRKDRNGPNDGKEKPNVSHDIHGIVVGAEDP